MSLVVRPPVRPSVSSAPPALYRRRAVLNGAALLIGDVAALGAAFAFAAALRDALNIAPLSPAWSVFAAALWPFGAGARRLLPGWGLGLPEEARLLTHLLAAVFAARAFALLVTGNLGGNEATLHALEFGVAWIGVFVSRAGTRRFFHRAGAWGVPVVVHGTGPRAALVVRALRENPGFGYTPIGVVTDAGACDGPPPEGVRAMSWTESVRAAPLAVVSTPHLDREALVDGVTRRLDARQRVLLVPDLPNVPSLEARPRDLGGALGFELTPPLSGGAHRLKRALDVAAVLATAPVWAPACLLIALVVWREDGASPLYVQERVGKDGRTFGTWKFRTMLPNAEDVLRRRLAEDAALREEWEAHFKLKRDPRVTRAGRALRKTSLDELPQLLNVLRGEMSLVGPRPLPRYHEERLSDDVRALRAAARPGLTGLWQVSGRSDAGTDGMERWDAYYVRNWSVWLDLAVVLRTIGVVLRGSGAY